MVGIHGWLQTFLVSIAPRRDGRQPLCGECMVSGRSWIQAVRGADKGHLHGGPWGPEKERIP